MPSLTHLESADASYGSFANSLHNADPFSTLAFATAARSSESMLYFGKDTQKDELRLDAYGQLEHNPTACNEPNIIATFWWKQPQKGLRIHPSVNGLLNTPSNLHFAFDMNAESPITAMRTEVYQRHTVLMFGNIALRDNVVKFEAVPVQYDNEALAIPAIDQLVGTHAAGITRKKVEDAVMHKLKRADLSWEEYTATDQ